MRIETESEAGEPSYNCDRCPRLRAFILENRARYPDYFNGPVPSFGPEDARLLIIGMAPGLHGANATGRPFTGDGAGDFLYRAIADHGFSRGSYAKRPDDGLELIDCRITNAVRCVPPQNKPTGPEARTCRPFLAELISAMPNLRAILTLGKIAHDSTIRTLERRVATHGFGHNAQYELHAGIRLFASYHCSRYNTNTRRLTMEMFGDVFGDIRTYLREQIQNNNLT